MNNMKVIGLIGKMKHFHFIFNELFFFVEYIVVTLHKTLEL